MERLLKMRINVENDEMLGRAIENKLYLELYNRLKEKDKEIERLNQYIDFYEDLTEKQNKEIERLNNIINELEHHLYQEWLEWKDSDCESIYSRAGEDKAIYDYIQELKGSDK